MTAKTNTERQEAYRARKADANLPEVRGIFAAPELHLAIKAAAAKLARKQIAGFTIKQTPPVASTDGRRESD